jgi:hypothetical protein
MRRLLCALFLAGFPLFLPATGLAEENCGGEEKTAEKVEIGDEDRQVIRNMELLQLMELLKDMDLLEGKIQPVPEDKQ